MYRRRSQSPLLAYKEPFTLSSVLSMAYALDLEDYVGEYEGQSISTFPAHSNRHNHGVCSITTGTRMNKELLDLISSLWVALHRKSHETIKLFS